MCRTMFIKALRGIFLVKTVVSLEKTTQDTLVIIYEKIFRRIKQDYVDVFLCGGASDKRKNQVSVRDKVRAELDKFYNIRILYPEDLFMEILNRDKDSDLLTLEKFLADNCDYICIICESAGSLVELGAFTNNDSTVNKVIAVFEENRKRDKSFIMLGPVKILKKNNKNKVVFYKNIEDLSYKLKRIFLLTKAKSGGENNKSLDTIIGMYFFIPLILFFYKHLQVGKLTEYLKYLFTTYKLKEKDFDTLFKTSLKLLYKEKLLHKDIINQKQVYSLTEKGSRSINQILNTVSIKQRTVLYDNIRFGIMNQLYATLLSLDDTTFMH